MADKWYVKHSGAGEMRGTVSHFFAGPMTQEEACNLATDCGGIPFSGEIFSPRFSVPAEVETLIKDVKKLLGGLQELKTVEEDRAIIEVDELFQLCSDTIDALTMLSQVRVVTGIVMGGVFEAGDIPGGVELVVDDYDVEGYEGDGLVEDDEGRECIRSVYIPRCQREELRDKIPTPYRSEE